METPGTPAALDAFLALPGPRWIFKHSDACPVSAAALGEIEAFLRERPGEAAALVVVQRHRPVSDHAARTLGVRHETPQALLLRAGSVLWHASHGRITRRSLAEARDAAERPGA